MMVVGAVGHLQMERNGCIHTKGAEKLFGQAGVERTDPLVSERRGKYQKRPPAHIQHGGSQCFIHGNPGAAIPGNAAFVAQCLPQYLPQQNANIFYCVVAIHFEVTFGADGQIHPGMDG